MFYARFDTTRKVPQYANGGHNPPLFVRRSTGQSWLLEEVCPIIGIHPDAQFSDASVALEAGNILAMFTDGVTEQENTAEDQFSFRNGARLIAAELNRCFSP